jgi:hypothetical protein
MKVLQANSTYNRNQPKSRLIGICPRLLLSLACSLPMLWGCAALVQPSASPAAPAIQVSIQNEFTSAPVNSAPITLIAHVEHDASQKGVSWSLMANGTNCPPGCGVITPVGDPSLSAIYTAPQSLPGGAGDTPTVIARSVANGTVSASFTFTLEEAKEIRIKISGTFHSIDAAGPPENLTAETNDPLGVNWTLTANGADCSPFCGTLEFSGGQHLIAVYTPPPVLASGASPDATITATSMSDSTKSASFGFTIRVPHTTNYALLLRGYDSAGVPMTIAGVVAADADGRIKDGELDFNDGGKTTSAKSLRGTFSTDTNFAGIIRGTLTISNFVFPGTEVNPVFKFVLRGNELEARVIEFDQSGNLAAGTILLQNADSREMPEGVYAFGLDSDAPVGRRTVAAGAFSISSEGFVVGVADQSQAQAPSSDQAEPLSGKATERDGLGRGRLSLSVNGTTTEYAYYLASAGQVNLIQIGGGFSFGTVLAGTARSPSSEFDPINGVYQTSVIQLVGVETPQGSNTAAPDAVIGVLSIAKDSSVALTFDSNNAGAASVGKTLSGTLVSYDSNTGRGVLSIPGGFQSGFVDNAVFYLYDNGEGYLIDADLSTVGGAINKAFSGTLVQQIPGPYDNESISGALIGISGAAPIPGIPNIAAALAADPSSGMLTGMAYATSVGTEAGQLSNVSFEGTFSVTDSASGHGILTLPAGFYGDFVSQAMATASFYLIGGNRFVSIGTRTGLPSGVTYVTPE